MTQQAIKTRKILYSVIIRNVHAKNLKYLQECCHKGSAQRTPIQLRVNTIYNVAQWQLAGATKAVQQLLKLFIYILNQERSTLLLWEMCEMHTRWNITELHTTLAKMLKSKITCQTLKSGGRKNKKHFQNYKAMEDVCWHNRHCTLKNLNVPIHENIIIKPHTSDRFLYCQHLKACRRRESL